MEYVYVDAALLAIPNYAIDTATAEALFERVAHFAKVSTQHKAIRVVVSEDVEDELWAQNAGPSYDQIREFIDIMDLGGIFSPADLTRVYQTLFNVPERAFSHNGFEVEECSGFASVPCFPAALGPTELVAKTQSILSEVAILNGHQDRWNVVTAFDYPPGQLLAVQSTIDSVKGTLPAVLGTIPTTVNRSVRVIHSTSDLSLFSSSLRIWMNGETADDIRLAIEIGVEEVLSKTASTDGGVRDFVIGSDFLQSLNDHQCARNGRFSALTHALCVQLISGTCNKRIGAIGRPQEIRDRDGGLGQRVHLTTGNPALRLMYWDINGLIEFANVGLKKDLEIRTG